MLPLYIVEDCAVPEKPQPGTGDEKKSKVGRPRNSNTPVNQIRKFDHCLWPLAIKGECLAPCR